MAKQKKNVSAPENTGTEINDNTVNEKNASGQKAAESDKIAEDVENKDNTQTKEDKVNGKNNGLSQREEDLKKENEKLKREVAKEKDDYLRLMADFDNFRRHSAQEKLDLRTDASTEIIKGLLPVLDDCERAIKMLEKSSDEVAKEGTALIYNKLMAFLKSKGIEEIKAKGEKFDTDFHEAVAQFPVEDNAKKGIVIDIAQTGYTLSGKVIRYAKVVVGI